MGLPGIGKSITSKAVSARYSEKGEPAIVLSIERKIEKFSSHIEILEIENKCFPIIVVAVPSISTDPEGLVKAIAASIDNLYRRTKDLPESIERLKTGIDNADTFNKILKDAVSNIPTHSQNFLPYIEILASAIPYANILLKAAGYILKKIGDKKIEDLGKKDILIVVDDLKDLEPNWNVLSKLFNYKFHFLFVLRVEDTNEYLDLLKDKTHLNRYLQNKVGIHVDVIEKRFISPPLPQIFQSIMNLHSITDDVIEDLWKYSGGITATALMMWYAAGKNGLKEFVKKVRDNMMTDNGELSWKTDDVAKRLSYTHYAAREIYNTLRSTPTLKFKNNYAYVALVAQPDGVSIDELLLFCGCSFGIVHPFDNRYVQDVVKAFQKGSCCPESRQIDVKPSAPYTGNEVCSHILDGSIVDEYEESWTIENMKSGEMRNEPAPTLSGVEGKRKVYRFNGLFNHLPLILQQVEKYDKNLQSDMERARKILLNILNQEVRITGSYSDGLVYSAYQHILKIQDVSSVEEAIVNFLLQMIISSPLLDLEIWNTTKKKFAKAAGTNEVYDAKMYLSLAFIAKRHKSQEMAQKIINDINSNPIPSDHINLLILAYTLAYITPLFGFDKQGDDVQIKSEEIIKKLCKKQDSICLYAKSYVYPQYSEYYFSRANYSKFRNLLDDASVALEKLKELYYSDKKDLGWMKNLNLNPSLELFIREKILDSIKATLLYYSDNLREASLEYQKTAKIEEKLRLFDGSLKNRDQEVVCTLMESKDDDSFEAALKRMSQVDLKILEWLNDEEEKKDKISRVSAETITMLHSHAAFASLAIGKIYEKRDLFSSYQRSQLKPIDEKLLFFPHFEAIYFCGLEVLESIMKGSSNSSKFITHALEYSKSFENLVEISKLLLAFHTMTQYKKSSITLELEGFVREVSSEWLGKYLINQLDSGFGQDFCKIGFRETSYSDENLIAEGVCSIMSSIERTYAYTIIIGLCLLYKKYDMLIQFLRAYVQNSGEVLLCSLFSDLINDVKDVRDAKTDEEKRLSRKKLAKAFVRIWYY